MAPEHGGEPVITHKSSSNNPVEDFASKLAILTELSVLVTQLLSLRFKALLSSSLGLWKLCISFVSWFSEMRRGEQGSAIVSQLQLGCTPSIGLSVCPSRLTGTAAPARGCPFSDAYIPAPGYLFTGSDNPVSSPHFLNLRNDGHVLQ